MSFFKIILFCEDHSTPKLYPYYWGERKSWSELYQSDDNDPTFRAFMQSGMARVVVTVRPGFEEAVSHFSATGQIWNGGEVPVIDDPLFLSLVDEMRSPEATKEGEPWRERIPTSLNAFESSKPSYIGDRIKFDAWQKKYFPEFKDFDFNNFTY